MLCSKQHKQFKTLKGLTGATISFLFTKSQFCTNFNKMKVKKKKKKKKRDLNFVRSEKKTGDVINQQFVDIQKAVTILKNIQIV